MKNRNGFRAAGSDPGDDIFSKYLATIGTPNFPEIVPEIVPKEFQRKDRLLIWMEYELLHRDIIRRKKK